MSNLFNRILNTKNKINSSSTQNEKMATEGIKINMKGQRVNQNIESNFGMSTFDTEMQGIEKGPPMLNMRTRVKVWGALFCAGLYFYLCYRLIIFRLKADDLDLMEREVNEEFKLKTKLKELNKIN